MTWGEVLSKAGLGPSPWKDEFLTKTSMRKHLLRDILYGVGLQVPQL